jgi:uncharacterized membrane protein YfcA
LPDVTLPQYALVAVVAFLASIVGGIAGYGPGLLMPLVLVPIIGPEPVIPVMSLAGLFTNTSRVVAFWADFHWRRAALVAACAVPTCVLGAYSYTRLTGPSISLLIGSVLILLIPARRLLASAQGRMPTPGVALAASGYGLLIGGTVGSGVILLSILMASGLQGMAVIATDAGISFALGLIKVTVFQNAGAMPAAVWIMALMIGVVATPGAFIAKRLSRRLTLRAHTNILDGVVVVGGVILIAQGLRS